MKKKYTVIDLFSGAGGLSLGFSQTGRYSVKAAFENNPCMKETYRLNHPGVDVFGDVCLANYQRIKEMYGTIDVVIGGPPCQGFSNANRQKNHAISSNNMLVRQYIRAILELQPKAFVMENVSMLHSDTHRFYMSEGDAVITERYGIPVKDTVLPLVDRDFYYEGLIDILTDREKIISYLWPEEEYTTLNVIYKASRNRNKMIKALDKHKQKITKMSLECSVSQRNDPIIQSRNVALCSIMDYYESKSRIGVEQLKKLIEPAIMYQRMLGKALEIIDNKIIVDRFDNQNGVSAVIKSFAVFDYLVGILGAEENGYVIANKVLNAADFGAPQKRMRFVVMGVKREISDTIDMPKGIFTEKNYRTVRDAIADLENITPYDNLNNNPIKLRSRKKMSVLATQLRDSVLLYNHIVTKTTDVAMRRFQALQQGENFHSLSEDLKTNTYTDVSRTQNTIYLRLAYDEPCGTVVNVRKSMWVHPTKDRAISVREAARLQTFPDSFVFCGTKDKQYQQVGNAVPPILAKAIAEYLADLLDWNT